MPYFNNQQIVVAGGDVAPDKPKGVSGDPFPNLECAKGQTGDFVFDFGQGEFQAYVDDGWVMVLQYVHAGGTNPNLNVINGGNWPEFDGSPLGSDGSGNLASWGHISQSLAGTIPDLGQLRFYGVTDQHPRVVNFATPVLGKFVSNSDPYFAQGGIRTNFTPLAGHTASIPSGQSGTSSNGSAQGDLALTHEAVFTTAPGTNVNRHWDIKAFGAVWEVDDFARTTPTGAFGSSTIHRVFVGAA